MSALTGVPSQVTGRIATGVGPATQWWSAMPFNALGQLVVVIAPGALPRNFNGSVSMLASTGQVCIDTLGAIDRYVGGLPLTAAGDLCVSFNNPTSYSQGVGIAGGRVSIS